MNRSFRLPRPAPFLVLTLLLLTSAVWAGCDNMGDTTANLSGVVREADTQTPLAGVTVELGSAETTSDQDGRFAFRDVPVGSSVMIEADAVGFIPYREQIAVQEGDNTHDISMNRKTYYQIDAPTINIGVHVTPGVPTYRGVVFFVPPGTVDALGFANGGAVIVPNPPYPDAEVFLNAHVAGLRERSLLLAQEHGLALMGAQRPDSGQPFGDVIAALEQVADQSGHPELAQAPLLLVGHSSGGCFAYEFTRSHSDRVIGFMSQKGDCHSGGIAPQASRVPGYLFMGELDSPAPAAHSITRVFEANRPGGALWALAVEPEAVHTPVDDLDLFARWMDTVLEQRLPDTAPPGLPVTLNALDETSGWLGNRETFSIAAYAQYSGDRQQASWLPTMETAQDWQALVSGGD